MKKIALFLSVLMLFSFKAKDGTLTKEEREFATNLLKETEAGVLASVDGLSQAQMKFKPAPDRWSVEECMKHIAISEKNLRAMVDGALKQPENGAKRTDVKMTDEELIKGTEDRSTKRKTFDALKPENTPYTDLASARGSFMEDRQRLIAFVNETKEDLRSHISVLPMGALDAYQLVLLIGAHTNRHMQQINEVKAHPNFPKK